MTTPDTFTLPSPKNYDPDAVNGAVDNFSQQLVGGGQLLVKNPGLVQALATGHATSQQSQAINQFLLGLNAQTKLVLAQKNGTKAPLSPDEMVALDHMGIDYSKDLYTANDAFSDLNAQMASKGLTVNYGPDGRPLTTAKGDLVLTPTAAAGAPKKKSPWSLNPLSDLKHVGTDTLSGLNMGWNTVDSTITDAAETLKNLTPGVGSGPLQSGALIADPGSYKPDLSSLKSSPLLVGTMGADPNSPRAVEMRAMGYDPNSAFSQLAFRARGYAHTDTTSLANGWDQKNPDLFGLSGPDAVAQVEKYSENPQQYMTDTFSSTSSLTPQQQAQRLQLIQSPQFKDLSLRVNSKSATVGNEFANALGVNPVDHPKAYALTAGAVDTAASFILDPTLLAGKAYQAAKFARIGLSSASDTGRIATILDKTTLGPLGRAGLGWRAQIQRNLQFVVDQSNDLRTALTAGDTVTAAKIQAQVSAQSPLMGRLMQDFTGASQIVKDGSGSIFKDSLERDGGKVDTFNIGSGEPITTYEDAVKYIVSKTAMLRLYDGRAAAEATLMPGAVSKWGYRAIKGKTAGAGAARSATANVARDTEYAAARDSGSLGDIATAVSENAAKTADAETTPNAIFDLTAAKAADPGQGVEDILGGDKLLKVLPSSQDAVDRAGNVLAAAEAGEATGGLASARRALSASEKGEAAFNLRSTGSADGSRGALGWSSPRAMAARARLTQAKLTQLLPRDDNLHLDGSESVDKLTKFARTYLNVGDANLLAAQWSAGDAATRKALAQGLQDQVMHSAGLTRTVLGKAMIDQAHAYNETYTHIGDIVVHGRAVTPHPGMVQDVFTLPAFAKVRRAAASVTAYEHTVGKIFESDGADVGKTFLNMNMLLKPATAFRLSLESLANSATRGDFGRYLAAKSVTNDKLAGTVMDRSRVNNAVRSFAPLSLMGSFYRHVARTLAPEAELKAMESNPDDMASFLHELGGAHQQSDLDPSGMHQVQEITEDGFAPVRMQYDLASADDSLITGRDAKGRQVQKIKTGFAPETTNGFVGAVRYSTALAQRVNKTPDLAKAVLSYLKDGQSDIRPVMDALESPKIRHLTSLTGYGKYVFDESTNAWRDAVDPREIALGKEQWAQSIADDFKYLLTNPKGVTSSKISDYIASTGKAPGHDWIMDNVENADRPIAVNSAQYAAVPLKGAAGTVKQFANAVNDVEGKAYSNMVERPLQRMMSGPTYLLNYGKGRAALERDLRPKLLEAGLSDEAADASIHNLARRQAVIASKDVLDDPGLKGQMDIVARNFLSFPRAAREMVRRWGITLYQDPTRARKVMLGLEGAEHSGLVYDNSYGEKTFTYPGSGVMSDALQHVMGVIPGMGGFANVPVSGDMLGNVTSLGPGLNNPLRFSLSPMVNVPLRALAGLNPDHATLWNEIDTALNGSEGAGRSAGSEVMPAWFRGFAQTLDPDSKDSLTSSASIGALANLLAADPDGSKGIVPKAGATPADIDQFLQRIKTNTRNQLYIRAAFGLFAPAAPSAPTEGTPGSTSDYAFHVLGINNLSDEYKSILNMTDGDIARTNTIWSTLHPDKLVYEQPATESKVQKSVLPATAKSAAWMESNLGFMKQYSNVASYFIPSDTGQFSDAAYRSQLELGIRQRKTPAEFYNTARITSAEQVYYPQYDNYQAALAQTSDPAQRASMKQQWSLWTTQFKGANPLFGEKVSNFEDARAVAGDQLRNLKEMVAKNQVPNGWGGNVSTMLNIYNSYESWKGEHKGTDAYSLALKQGAAAKFHTAMAAVVTKNPQLGDLYSGVFRSLDSNLFPLSDIPGSGD